MKCPYCGFGQDRVVDSRESKEADSIRRRRECERCNRRFLPEIECTGLALCGTINHKSATTNVPGFREGYFQGKLNGHCGIHRIAAFL